MANPLIRKLSNYIDLSEDDRQALKSLAQQSKSFAAHTDLIHEGDPTGGVFLILTGWACRYKVLPDGQRQIMAYFIPGDLCDQRIFILQRDGSLYRHRYACNRGGDPSRNHQPASLIITHALREGCGGARSWMRRSRASGSSTWGSAARWSV